MADKENCGTDFRVGFQIMLAEANFPPESSGLNCSKVVLLCPLCPVVSVSLPRGDSRDCEWICDLVVDVGSAVLLLQFFQSGSV